MDQLTDRSKTKRQRLVAQANARIKTATQAIRQVAAIGRSRWAGDTLSEADVRAMVAQLQHELSLARDALQASLRSRQIALAFDLSDPPRDDEP